MDNSIPLIVLLLPFFAIWAHMADGGYNNRISENAKSINRLNSHNHAADGSINGIRGWY